MDRFIKRIKILLKEFLTGYDKIKVDEEFKEQWQYWIMEFWYSCKLYDLNGKKIVRKKLSKNPDLRFLELVLLQEAERCLNAS